MFYTVKLFFCIYLFSNQQNEYTRIIVHVRFTY